MRGFKAPKIKIPKAPKVPKMPKSSAGKVTKFVSFKPTITKSGKFRNGGVRLAKRRAA